MPKLILFDHISPTCCLKTDFRTLNNLKITCFAKLTENSCMKVCVEITPGTCPELQVPLSLLELSSHPCALVQEVQSSRFEFCPQVRVPLSSVLCTVHLLLQDLLLASVLGESCLGKPWFCCFIRTRSFSGLLLNLYPKLSQFQPINLLISFPSPCGTPGKGKCPTFDVV